MHSLASLFHRSMSYQYQPLDRRRREIRLLEIKPSPTFSAPVECKAFKTNLEDAPEYIALSYCWWDASVRLPIIVDGVSFPVTVNLCHALRRLRHADQSRVYWIDAICIDQTNNPEKSHQVTMMRDLYHRAEFVDVWLGEEGEDSSLAVELIRMLTDTNLVDNLVAATEAVEIIPIVSNLYEQNPGLLDETAWLAVRRLFERPWWTRVWVFQEFIVSKAAVFRCGPDRFDWLDLSTASVAHERIVSSPLRSLLTEDQLIYLILANFSIPMDFIHVKLPRYFESRELGDLLNFSPIHLMTRLKSTDPRDLVYALLGVAELKNLLLVPDYDKPISEVYAEFTMKYIMAYLDLSIISLAGIGILGDQYPLDTPSWVPDFRSGTRHGQSMSLGKYRASGGRKSIFSFSSGSKILNCDGVVVDTITSQRQHERWPKRSWQDLVLSHAEVPHPTGISQYQVFFRTTITDDSVRVHGNRQSDFFDEAAGFMYIVGADSLVRRKNDPVFVKQMARFMEGDESGSLFAQNFTVWRCSSLDFVETGIPSKKEMLDPFLAATRPEDELQWPEPYDESGVARHAQDWAFTFEVASSDRALFITAKGYMGMGPPDSQIGDKICVVLGCDKPLVIRAIGEKYLVVGKCYIYGLMNGEILAEVEEGKMVVETLHFE